MFLNIWAMFLTYEWLSTEGDVVQQIDQKIHIEIFECLTVRRAALILIVSAWEDRTV